MWRFLKKFLIVCFSSTLGFVQAQNAISIAFKGFQGSHFYESIDSENSKLLIFLHGGVANPYFKQPAQNIEVDFLLEDNNAFVHLAHQNSFDLIVPITNQNLDWLNEPEKTFNWIREYVKSNPKPYTEIYISGFSDGGTGSFKIFYNHPNFFDGLVVFNGYPQHRNFHKTVDYEDVVDKKLVLVSTFKDKVIPYEFLMTEYVLQKSTNAQTYLYVTEGDHDFKSYTLVDLHKVFDVLTGVNRCGQKQALHGFLVNDTLQEVYPYRKKIVRQFNHGKTVYEENKSQLKRFKVN